MKKLWNQNRVVFVLIIILIACFIAIVGVALSFFYRKDVSEYGQRLEDIDKYPITSELKKNLADFFEEAGAEYSYTQKGRILYLHLNFDEEEKIEDAQKLAQESLDLFSEDLLSYYDITFCLKSDNFLIYGAKNSIIDHISWNNNRPVEEETDEEEK